MSPTTATRRDMRLRAIARQIIRHGYNADEVAHALARTALEYTERNIGEAAVALGLPAAAIERVLSAGEAMEAIRHGEAAASGEWDPGQGAWPADGNHD